MPGNKISHHVKKPQHFKFRVIDFGKEISPYNHVISHTLYCAIPVW